jgi:hypothetical protein
LLIGFDLTRKVGDAVDRSPTAERLIARGAGASEAPRIYALAGGSAVSRSSSRSSSPTAAEADEMHVSIPSELPGAVSANTIVDLHDFGVIATPAALEPPAPAVDIGRMAALCSDLAKVADTRALPDLLARASEILEAVGVLQGGVGRWAGVEAPRVVAGHAVGLVTRLGTIQRDASNLTASAYRTALLQTVKGDAVSNGAIAAPLVSAAGCVGVLAVEMRDGGEQHAAMLSAAAIIASHLATLVGPPSARATRTEAAG